MPTRAGSVGGLRRAAEELHRALLDDRFLALLDEYDAKVGISPDGDRAANDPVAVHKALLEPNPPRIDFLLPHATWEQPPRRAVPVRTFEPVSGRAEVRSGDTRRTAQRFEGCCAPPKKSTRPPLRDPGKEGP